MSFFQILAVIGLNESFLHIYKENKKNFWKKLFFGSFTPFFVPKWPFLPKITHFINFLVFNFLNKCKMNILWNTKYLWRKTKRKIMKKKIFLTHLDPFLCKKWPFSRGREYSTFFWSCYQIRMNLYDLDVFWLHWKESKKIFENFVKNRVCTPKNWPDPKNHTFFDFLTK